ncbi:60S acidic ribosomal protein P0 [Trachipleistophora hominis]|uniref:60S acidic ribosomal protein P0 n=1 Tax=Trachipleistophora hominis TaxID=72359 RepID=L7JZ32_TRAHO|nr:60S acidic ribosomal protein P0 [Trachipleistophora hominis]
MVAVSKKEKNAVHYTKIKECLGKYNQIILFEMNPVRTNVLHKMREVTRDTTKIIFGKKLIIRKALKDVDDDFLKCMTANTFLVFTNEDTSKIVDVILKYNVASSEKLIPKGILKINNVAAPTVIKKNLDKLNFVTKEKNGVLMVENAVELDTEKDKKLIKLLRMDDISINIKPLCVISNGNYQKI